MSFNNSPGAFASGKTKLQERIDERRKLKAKGKAARRSQRTQSNPSPGPEMALYKGKSPERPVEDSDMMDVAVEEHPAAQFNWTPQAAAIASPVDAWTHNLELPFNNFATGSNQQLQDYEPEPMDTRESPPRNAVINSVEPISPAPPVATPLFNFPDEAYFRGSPFNTRRPGAPTRYRSPLLPLFKPTYGIERGGPIFRDPNSRIGKKPQPQTKTMYGDLKDHNAIMNKRKALVRSIEKTKKQLDAIQKEQERKEKEKKRLLQPQGKHYKMQLPIETNPFAVESVEKPETADEEHREKTKEERKKLRQLKREERKRKKEANDALQQLKAVPVKPVDPIAVACSQCRQKLRAAARSRTILSLHTLCGTCQRRLYPDLTVVPPTVDSGVADVADGAAYVDADAKAAAAAAATATAAAEDSEDDSADDSDSSNEGEPQEPQEAQGPAKWSYAWILSQLKLGKSQPRTEQQKKKPRVAHPAVARKAPGSSAPATANAANEEASGSNGNGGEQASVAKDGASAASAALPTRRSRPIFVRNRSVPTVLNDLIAETAASNERARPALLAADRRSRSANGVRKHRADSPSYGPNDPRLFRRNS